MYNFSKDSGKSLKINHLPPHQKPCQTKNIMYKFLGIFLAGWLLFSCSSDKPEVVEELKKANAKDFSFSLLSVNAKEVSVEKIKSILKNPTGWTIKSLKIDDESFAEVTGTSVKDFKIKIKKAGEFSFSITLQKKGYEDFVLKGVKIKATFLADAKDFSFKLLELTGAKKEVTIEQIKKNLKALAGWTIKSVKIDDESFAAVTGTSVKDFKITIKKTGAFSFSIILQKTGYEDFILKGTIKVNASTEPPKKADPSKFGFPLLPVNAKEIPIATIERNLTKPTGWTIKTIAVADSDFGTVTGADSSQKIVLKKGGAFVINITLQKAGWVDFVLKGNIKAAKFTATASGFSFPELPVNAKEIPLDDIKRRVKKPTGWTIKTIAVADSDFGTVSSQKIVLKKDGTFVINITLQKTGWVDFVLKGTIKASTPTQPPKKADPSKFSFPELPVNAKEIPIAMIESNLTKPTGWTIKSIVLVNSDFGTVTGTGSTQKIVLKKGGTFVINITLQKTGFVDFVLKGNIKAANLTADASGFTFPELPVNAKEIPFATIESNLTKPAGWTIKTIAVTEAAFGEVTGTGSSQKIVLKKGGGTFGITITLQKTGWVDFVLKGNIKAANLKADAKDFGFPLLSVNAKEIPIDDIKRRVKKPAGWTIKSIAVVNSDFGTVSSQKIVLKKGGTFVINITLQKAGWVHFVLKGNIKAANLTADAKDFSFPLLSVNAKEIPFATIESNLKKPMGWTIKTIAVDDSTFGEIENQKLKIKPPTTFASRTFTISITLEKTGWVDYTLKGSIKADHSAFYLTFDKANKTITGVTDKTITTINIPNEIEGVAVEKIGNMAFMDCLSLTSVTLPNSVTTIGMAAFFRCGSLTSVTIPDKVTTIGKGALRDCSSLTSVTIPDKVTTIEMQTFLGCTSLTSLTIPNSVTAIGEYAFERCSSLTSVTIGNSITTIGEGAFFNCSSLTSITISDSVTTIGGGAFSNCKKLAVKFLQPDPSKITFEKYRTFYVFGTDGDKSTWVKEILVPRGSLAAYRGIANISAFSSIMKEY